MSELVSVIVPIYAVEDLLPRCVDSLLRQSYLQLEIILVDDGSPDACGELCDEYSRSDDRIVSIHQENGGLSSARNAGLEAATGTYVTFVDSDDWVHLDYVSELVRAAEEHGAEISVCGHEVRHEAGDQDPPLLHAWKTICLTNVEALGWLKGPTSRDMVVSWGKLYRRELFDGVTFPTGRLHEDIFTTHILLWRAQRVAVTSRPLYFYWQRLGSITSTNSWERRRDLVEGYAQRGEFFDALHMRDEAAYSYRKAFWLAATEWNSGRRGVDRARMGDAAHHVKSLGRNVRRREVGFRVLVQSCFYSLLVSLPPRLLCRRRSDRLKRK